MKLKLAIGVLAMILSACSFPQYEWRNAEGRSQTLLGQDKDECYRYANQVVPPGSYYDRRLFWNDPYWDPYWDSDWPYRRFPSHPYNYYYYPGYWGYPTPLYFQYREDIFRACMKGKGWYLAPVDKNAEPQAPPK